MLEAPSVLPELLWPCWCRWSFWRGSEHAHLPLPASSLSPCSAQVTRTSQVRDSSRYRWPPVFRHSSQASFSHHIPSFLHLDLSELSASNRTLILFSVQPPPWSCVHQGSWPHSGSRADFFFLIYEFTLRPWARFYPNGLSPIPPEGWTSDVHSLVCRMSVSLFNNLHPGWTQRLSIYFLPFFNLLLLLIISPPPEKHRREF